MPDEMIQYLPAIYQAAGEHSLLTHLLAAFESVLLKRGPGSPGKDPALEEVVADLPRFFDPMRAPAHFLPWLAGWAAMSPRTDLSESRQRDIIGRIIPLYGRRGTRQGIAELVELFTGGTIEIEEPVDLEFQIEDHSTIGKDIYLGGPPPHIFHVIFTPPEDRSHSVDERALREELNIKLARSVIEMAKPAHTWYTLDVVPRKTAEQAGVKGKERPGPPSG
jgi:phage tail-like protein